MPNSFASNIKNEVENMKNQVNELQELAKRYKDYKRVVPTKLPYREPQNDFEKKCCKKVRLSTSIPTAIIAVAMIAVLILLIVNSSAIKGNPLVTYGIVGVLTLIPIIIFVLSLVVKDKVCEALVIRTTMMVSKSGKDSAKRHYSVSVHIDNPDRIMSDGIEINRKFYKELSENDKVLVVHNTKTKAFPIK